MIIAGERRWRASNLAGLTEVPCIELDIDEQTIAEIALVENLQRKDLTIWEVADGLADLAEQFEYTHEDIAQKIAKSRTSVTESLAIAGLPESIRERCRAKKIEAKSTLVEISREFDEDAMHTLLDRVTSKGGTVARETVRKKKQTAAVQRNEPESASASSEEEECVFTYSGLDGNFDLTIKHINKHSVSRTDLLRALKEAFDAVKAGD